MGKVLKWLAGIFLGVLVLTGICLAVLVAIIDEETVKTQLADVARAQTGGELAIDGELGWSVFPQLGVSVDQLRFTPKDEAQPLAAVGTLRLGVDFLPLFRGQVNVGEVTLSGVRLDLVKGADGTGNWEKLQLEQSASTEPEQPQESEEPAADEGTSGGIQLAISTLNIDDTQVNYSDRQSGASYQLADFGLHSEAVNLEGEPFPVTVGFTVNTPEAKLVFDLDTTLSGNLEAQRFQLSELLSTIAVSGPATNGQTVTTRVATSADLDLATEQATLNDLRIELADLVLAGQLGITRLTSAPQVSGNLQSEAFSPRQLMTQLGLEAPALSNDKALQHMRFGANISANAKRASLDDILVELDQSKATGKAAITDLEKQSVTAQLTLDKINVDDYQMAGAAGSGGGSGSSGGSASGGKSSGGNKQSADNGPLLPIEMLQGLDVAAKLDIGTLIASGMTLSDVVMQVSARGGLVNLSKLQAKLYRGTTHTSASIDARSNNPAWKINTKVSGVQVGPLLKDAGDIDWIEGVFDFTGNLTSRGNNQYALKKNLKGPANFSLTKGVLREMNLEQTVCQGIALINQKSLSQSWGPDTQLNNIEGKLQFGGGKIVNKSLTGGLKNTHLKGSGDVDMLKEDFEYDLGVRILGTMREVDPACEVNERYRDIYWPLRCAGKLSEDPKDLCGVDDSAMGDIANRMLQEEIKQRAGDELEDKAKKELQRLFDRL